MWVGDNIELQCALHVARPVADWWTYNYMNISGQLLVHTGHVCVLCAACPHCKCHTTGAPPPPHLQVGTVNPGPLELP